MIDIHAHLCSEAEQELAVRKEHHIYTCYSCGTPDEWNRMVKLNQQKAYKELFCCSFGIHPWYSDRFTLQDCKEALQSCVFVGETGMDSVWCDVPYFIQKKQFEKHLQAAADFHKPVLLHTKGMEKEIREMIRNFPGKICVHWYSGSLQDLTGYFEEDCYFTLGPDFMYEGLKGQESTGQGRVYRCILDEMPLNRLFLETDGRDAIAWALGKEQVSLSAIPAVLRANMRHAAEQKGISEKILSEQMQKNWNAFISSEKTHHL